MTQRIRVQSEIQQLVEQYLSDHNLGRRGIADGDCYMQKTGLIGEMEVIKYLTGRYPYLHERDDEFDGGFDIDYNGRLIDVKTMGRKYYVKPSYVNNFYLLQLGYKADTIVFCSLNVKEEVLEICGWIEKSELLTIGKQYKIGETRTRSDGTTFTLHQDICEVENMYLKDIELLK